MKLRLYYPVRPKQVKQAFGVNPDYYKKFHDYHGNPLKGHDGIDFAASHGTPVYAAHDGRIHFERDAHGGEGMAIHTTQEYEFENAKAYFISIYWHLIGDTDPAFVSPFRTDGKSYPVKAGDLIGYADNTGAPYESDGTHLHFGLFPVDGRENTLNIDNGFNGRINPEPYFTGIYADVVHTLLGALVETLKKMVEYYKSVRK